MVLKKLMMQTKESDLMLYSCLCSEYKCAPTGDRVGGVDIYSAGPISLYAAVNSGAYFPAASTSYVSEMTGNKNEYNKVFAITPNSE